MSTKQRPTCRVLYVEDTREDQQILREAILFADVPVELVTANTAEAALEMLSGTPDFHVLVLDWNLPAITGVEFLTALRVKLPTVPVTILTGEPRMVDAPTAARLGAATIVRKPLLLEEWEQLAMRLYDECSVSAQAAATR